MSLIISIHNILFSWIVCIDSVRKRSSRSINEILDTRFIKYIELSFRTVRSVVYIVDPRSRYSKCHIRKTNYHLFLILRFSFCKLSKLWTNFLHNVNIVFIIEDYIVRYTTSVSGIRFAPPWKACAA